MRDDVLKFAIKAAVLGAAFYLFSLYDPALLTKPIKEYTGSINLLHISIFLLYSFR